MPKYSIYVIELDKSILKVRAFQRENPDYIEGKPCLCRLFKKLQRRDLMSILLVLEIKEDLIQQEGKKVWS